MTIDEQIAALNKLIAHERMQSVRREAKQVSAKYSRLVAERDGLASLRGTHGGDFETALSAGLVSTTTEDSTPSIPIRAVSGDAVALMQRENRRARLLSIVAEAKKEPRTEDSQRSYRSGSY